jgi:hypothetical protein
VAGVRFDSSDTLNREGERTHIGHILDPLYTGHTCDGGNTFIGVYTLSLSLSLSLSLYIYIYIYLSIMLGPK